MRAVLFALLFVAVAQAAFHRRYFDRSVSNGTQEDSKDAWAVPTTPPPSIYIKENEAVDIDCKGFFQFTDSDVAAGLEFVVENLPSGMTAENGHITGSTPYVGVYAISVIAKQPNELDQRLASFSIFVLNEEGVVPSGSVTPTPTPSNSEAPWCERDPCPAGTCSVNADGTGRVCDCAGTGMIGPDCDDESKCDKCDGTCEVLYDGSDKPNTNCTCDWTSTVKKCDDESPCVTYCSGANTIGCNYVLISDDDTFGDGSTMFRWKIDLDVGKFSCECEEGYIWWATDDFGSFGCTADPCPGVDCGYGFCKVDIGDDGPTAVCDCSRLTGVTNFDNCT
jgi:hypothetical protein